MLELQAVRCCYGEIEALKKISLYIREGEIIALLGANGAGKSTTLMSISGIVPIAEGQIKFYERPIHVLRPHQISALGIVQVPEGRRIFTELTVLENLDMGAYLRKDRAGVRQDLNYIFTLFPQLAIRRHQLGGSLSGGEQQMLAISRGLMSRPKVLLLDEPSLGLSPLLVNLIFETIRKINRENKTTIFLVEQNAHRALSIAHRGYVMERGIIILADTADNLSRNERVKSAYLGI
jgi:branched-chain amino acid transport system ATP-binding protein